MLLGGQTIVHCGLDVLGRDLAVLAPAAVGCRRGQRDVERLLAGPAEEETTELIGVCALPGVVC